MILNDGPQSTHFSPIALDGNYTFSGITLSGVSERLVSAASAAPQGHAVAWGIPFEITNPIVLTNEAAQIDIAPTHCRQLIFMHTSDIRPDEPAASGFITPMRGEGKLGEYAANYIVTYEDGTTETLEIKRRFHIGAVSRRWGENCFMAVPMHKQQPIRASHEQVSAAWGRSQTRVDTRDNAPWMNWLYCWENPYPQKRIISIQFAPISGAIVISAITAGNASSNPLRWERRQKAIVNMPNGEEFDPHLNDDGLLAQIQLDLGQVIYAERRSTYPNDAWDTTHNNKLPVQSASEVLVEFTAHQDAVFHMSNGQKIPLAQLQHTNSELQLVAPATTRVRLRVVLQGTSTVVPVKLHVHGEAGEYLAPVDRHRTPNGAWFEDYSADFTHQRNHHCTYINGETLIDLPLGKVYVEISKGFEIAPMRRVYTIYPDTQEITVELSKVLGWRERGWVTADTHVHFLSPVTAMLEGSAEGVNVVNLLASQWGELMTNVGDFDGKTTWGSREAGGDGEYLVRVGTENRQHVMGHISLLGYQGNIIAPMTSGGPDESAIGDSIEVLLSEWAQQCKQQAGLVVLPHFPNPRAEHAATIVNGDVDALEMTSWGNLYYGIDPYSLSDWYRYLNCGYMIPACGGTDKMSADTAVGTIRTYARIADDLPFTYRNWMDAVRRGETFVTYGPLLDFMVEGKSAGSTILLNASGGTLSVHWQVSTVTVPVNRVELIVNGEIRASESIASSEAAGQWSIRLDKTSWLALLVRGQYPGHSEMIAAHSSPVLVQVGDTPMIAAADALTILEQIEGAIAYLDTIGTRASAEAYKRMRMVLTASHRSLHNRMHALGHFHNHTPVTDHPEHH